MPRKATYLSETSPSERVLSERKKLGLLREYRQHKHLAELTDVTPGHLIARLQNFEPVVYSALPFPDVWHGLHCEFCRKPVFILNSLGPVLVLQKDPIGLMATRHECPKMRKHNGVFLK